MVGFVDRMVGLNKPHKQKWLCETKVQQTTSIKSENAMFLEKETS